MITIRHPQSHAIASRPRAARSPWERHAPAWRVFLALLLSALITPVQAAAPVITNIRAAQRSGTHLIDIHYNLSDPDGDSPITIHLAVSSNAGASYNVPVFTTTGAIGPNVAP